MAIQNFSPLQLNGTLSVGVDDTGHDVKFFGATSGEYMLWDESEDALFLADNTQLRIGAGGDLRAYHNGTNSYFGNYTGDLFIFNNANDKDIVFQCDDGSNGTTAYLTLDGSATTINVAKNMHFGDGVYANFGASSDIEIAHVNNQSYIINNVGNLEFRQNTNDGDIIFQCDDGSNGVTPYITLDGSAANIKIATDMIFADNKAAMFGTGGDAFLKHDGSNCNFINDTGNVTFTNRTDDGDIIFSSDNGSGGTAEYFRVDGGGGVTYFSKHLQMADSQNIYVGGGGDMSIVHDGTNSFIVNSTGNLTIDSATNDADIIFKGTDGGSDITALTLDMSAAGKATFNNDVVAFSDRKLKENIQTLDGKKVLEMRGVSFTRKDTKEQSSGVIAQEMQEVAPELVSESQGTLGVSYGNLVGYLIEAVKDQQKQIDELKAMINGSSK